MSPRKNKQHLFTTDLLWTGQDSAVINSDSTEQAISVTNPTEFGGADTEWSVEHLFLSSVAGCILRMYIVYAKKLQFENTAFECTATGQAEMVDDHYRFTYIHLYPKAYISTAEDEKKALLAMEKAKKHCMISNSVNATIILHPEVVIGKPETKTVGQQKNGKRHFTTSEARQVGKKIGVNFSQYDLEEFRRGLEVEMEHGTQISESNVTNDDVYMTGKIAWAHLHEIPDYYTRLDKMEREAEQVSHK